MDITYIPMARGFVYLAVVLDCFSGRQIEGPNAAVAHRARLAHHVPIRRLHLDDICAIVSVKLGGAGTHDDAGQVKHAAACQRASRRTCHDKALAVAWSRVDIGYSSLAPEASTMGFHLAMSTFSCAAKSAGLKVHSS